MIPAAVEVDRRSDGQLWRVALNRPKANILDSEMISGLTKVFAGAASEKHLKAICLAGAADHFSFGASVEEHLPDRFVEMLGAFHGLFRTIAEASVTLLTAIRGQCLGGGLELAAFSHRLFAAPGAKLGQPEIRLGVFAPVASVLLPERVGRAAAEDLCLSGRVLSAEQALAIGLVDEVAEDPEHALAAYFEEHLEPHSASSLRLTVKASRQGFNRRFFADLEAAESVYRDELMVSADAKEGLDAFLAKRDPEWRNA